MIPIPVSYTHLDVYKRQLENGMKVTAKVDVIVPLEDIIVSDSSLEMLPGQEKKVDVRCV